MSTNERWTAVKNLYTAALLLDEEQRRHYLDQNCADPDLRTEVEKLLGSESTRTEMYPTAVPKFNTLDILPAGTILGHYRIQKRLGAGGMGLVYEALDQKLQRTVAIKVIHPGSVAVQDRLRFLREAQSVSALNHPNIVTVYEAGQHEGVDFIAMERINGQTLKQKIGSKGMETRVAVRYATQIADALAAAHEAGIVHRDLKPGNVMVTDRDVVKVLDFGLAKREHQAGAPDESLTGQGRVVGTFAYMSPEQAQGRAVDKRSDIFSFGSVLYEMLTGLKAFQQDSHVGTMAAILHKEPMPLRDLPTGLSRVIGKCLQKKPHDRWQDMQDLKLVLAGFLEDLENPSTTIIADTAPPKRNRWLIPGVIVAIGLAAGAVAMYGWLMRSQPAETVNEPVYRMVTTDNGLNDYPALSRDGKFIAFASDRAGADNLDIWLQQIGGREMIQLTKDPADETDPSFSPDGTHIAYRSEREGGGIYVIQTLGGDPVLLASAGRNPRYSPDGKWIAYWVGRSEESAVAGSTRVYKIAASGGQPIPIHPEMAKAQFPVWSPSGSEILLLGMKGSSGKEQPDYWTFQVDGGGEGRQTGVEPWLYKLQYPGRTPHTTWLRRDFSAFEWAGGSGGGRLITGYDMGEGTSANLWEFRLDTKSHMVGAPRRVTSGPGRQIRGSLAELGAVERLSFSDVNVNYDVWSTPADPARTTGAAATRLTNSVATEWAPSVSADGRRLLFIARRSASWALIFRDLEAGHERVLFTAAAMPAGAALSGDGGTVVFSDSTFNLQMISAQGGQVQPLAGQRGTVLSLSQDGRYAGFEPVKDEDAIVFDTVQKRHLILASRPDSNDPLSGTHLSPDAKWVAFYATDHATRGTRIWAAAVDLKQPAPFQNWIAITDDKTFAQDPVWSADGHIIYFASERDGFRCFWGQRLNDSAHTPSGEPFAVAHFHSARRTLRGTVSSSHLTGLSVGGGRLFYSIAESKGSIWLEERTRVQ